MKIIIGTITTCNYSTIETPSSIGVAYFEIIGIIGIMIGNHPAAAVPCTIYNPSVTPPINIAKDRSS